MPQDPNVPPTDVAEQNIRAVADLERRLEGKRTLGERASGRLVRVLGSMPFAVFHLLLLSAWLVVNLGWVPGVPALDPFPFGILALGVSAEGVFLAIFVLIASNRLSREATQRAHLQLQVSLLAEAEVTKILALLGDLSRRLGHDPHLNDAQLGRLSEPTDLPAIADTLEREIDPEGA